VDPAAFVIEAKDENDVETKYYDPSIGK